MTTISVVIPSKDRPEFLARALASVSRQTYANTEIVVIDDGEGDALRLCRGVDAGLPLSAYDNVRRGQVAARNLGVSKSRGEVIAFLDDDDWWEDRTYLAKLAAHHGARRQATYASGFIVAEDGLATEVERLTFAARFSGQDILKDNMILVSGFSFDRALSEDVGPFDEALPFYWDWDWYIRLSRRGARFHDLGQAGVCISTRRGTVSSPEYVALRQGNLALLSGKHGLGALTLRNHESIARDALSAG